MVYMGGKDGISRYIVEFIALNRTKDQWYAEPFCGGCNVIDKLSGSRIAADNNKYLIAMWKGLQNDLDRPLNITKEMYDNAHTDFRNGANLYYSDFLIGWIGFMASFRGEFFSGYIGINNKRDYITERTKNIVIQIPKLKGVKFTLSDYDDLFIPENSVIYCDPPYIGTTEYKTGFFDHPKFYNWAENKSKEGHKVFISEYYMPPDRFTKVWSKKINSGMDKQDKTECLFIPKGQKIKKQLSIFDFVNV